MSREELKAKMRHALMLFVTTAHHGNFHAALDRLVDELVDLATGEKR